jgi:hypothetical protein
MTRHTLIALSHASLLIVAALAGAGAQTSPQFGLRLDDHTAMQWAGSVLMTQAESWSFTKLPAMIADVWPGPVRGSFAVVDARGVGMLLGATVVPSSITLEGGAIARSSRPDVVLIYRTTGAGGAISELRTPKRARVLLSFVRPLLDFDVAAAGSIAALQRDGTVELYVNGPTPTSTLSPQETRVLLEGEAPVRLFIDAAGSELLLLGERTLARVDLASGQATRRRFDPQTEALVRSAATRRMHVESRWSISKTR